MSEIILKDLKPGTEIVYRVHPGNEPQYGLFRTLTPSGKFAIVSNEKDFAYRTETVHLLEVLPRRVPTMPEGLRQQLQQCQDNGADGNKGKNEGGKQAQN